MILFPAIDLYEGKAVRLFKGRYDEMTVYGDPLAFARDFTASGCPHIHIVDLEGARSGETPNLGTVLKIKEETGAFCEVGGGVRSMEVVDRYLLSGVDRVILGTAAVSDEDLLKNALDRYGDRIAVGADLRDGFIAVKGWTETSSVSADAFFARMEELGVKTVICTDISRDGAMRGTNLALYRSLSAKHRVNVTASGGVSSLEDVRQLSGFGLYGAIVGKAYYTGALDLVKAAEIAGNSEKTV